MPVAVATAAASAASALTSTAIASTSIAFASTRVSAAATALSLRDGVAPGRRLGAPVVRGPRHGDRLPPLLPLHASGRSAMLVVPHAGCVRARPARDAHLPASVAAREALAAVAATVAAAAAAAALDAAIAAAALAAALRALPLRVGRHPGVLEHLQ